MLNGFAPHLHSPKPILRTNRRNRVGRRFLSWALSFGARWMIGALARDHAAGSHNAAAIVLTRSDSELGLEQVVDGLRIGLAAGRLPYLADGTADELRPWLSP